MTKQYSSKMARQNILETLQEKRNEKSTAVSTEKGERNSRGALELVRQTSLTNLNAYKFNDMTDFDIEADPTVIWDELNSFNTDGFDNRFTIEKNVEKKYIRMTMKNDEEYGDLDIKLKFFGLRCPEEDEDEDEDVRYRLKIVKKRGDLAKWYELLGEIKDTWLEGMLMAPQPFEGYENLATAEESPEEA